MPNKLMTNKLIVASANVAGLRGATLTGKTAKIGSGFDKWFQKQYKTQTLDILALQETKITAEEAEKSLAKLGINPKDFHLLPDNFKKGHAGVALWFNPQTVKVNEVRTPFEKLPQTEDLWFSGRWLEADVTVNGTNLTIISAYFHHADSPTLKGRDGKLIDRDKAILTMDRKHKFMAATTARMRDLLKTKDNLLVVGDINIAHHNLDLKNWKGNLTKAGFLPEERAWLDLWFGAEDMQNVAKIYKFNEAIDYHAPETREFAKGTLKMRDILREKYGEDAVYTWWTNMGHAFDNDAGWRIDYQIASPSLANACQSVRVDKQESYAKRYSDHAPVVAEFVI